MRKIFCFGNEYFQGDEVAKQLARKLESSKFEFIMAESPAEILNAPEELIILDVAKGIDNVTLLNDTSRLETISSLTTHDLDLNFFLKLMQQTGKIKDIKIIALPFKNSNYQKLKREVEKILLTL